MNDRHVIEELSAYIDGDASEPARIARHLQWCEACARHHMQLLKLSAHLRAMPAPETHPEFVTRIMAHAAGEPAPSAWRWNRLHFGVNARGIALAMILLVAGGIGGWMFWPASMPDSGPRMARSVMEPAVPFPEPSPLESIGNDAAGPEEPISYEELLTLLAESSPEEMEQAFFYDDAGLDDQIDALDEQEMQVLREILSEYLLQSHAPDNKG